MNENDSGDHGGHRRDRVQNDAELAMIGIAGRGMGMRDLNEGQQSQQSKAQHGGGDGERARSAWLGPALLESIQKMVTPYF